MECYIAFPDHLVVMEVCSLVNPVDRESVRSSLLKLHKDSTHVWFQDEKESQYDPIQGPYPVYGPKADIPRN